MAKRSCYINRLCPPARRPPRSSHPRPRSNAGGRARRRRSWAQRSERRREPPPSDPARLAARSARAADPRIGSPAARRLSRGAQGAGAAGEGLSPRGAHRLRARREPRRGREGRRRAIAALRHAVKLKPIWPRLGARSATCCSRGAIRPGADAAFARHDRVVIRRPRPPARGGRGIRGPADRRRRGPAARAPATRRPRDAEALRLMADIFLRQGRFADAETLLASALEIEPTHTGARFALADALFRQQKAPAAIAHLEALLAREPDNLAYLNLMAAALGLIGETTRSAEAYEASGQATRRPRPRSGSTSATPCAPSVAATTPSPPTVAASPSPRLSANPIGASPTSRRPPSRRKKRRRWRRCSRGPTSAAEDRLHLNYALGKALEDRGAYAEAFEHYTPRGRAAGVGLRPGRADAAGGAVQGPVHARGDWRRAKRRRISPRPRRSSSSACRGPARP